MASIKNRKRAAWIRNRLESSTPIRIRNIPNSEGHIKMFEPSKVRSKFESQVEKATSLDALYRMFDKTLREGDCILERIRILLEGKEEGTLCEEGLQKGVGTSEQESVDDLFECYVGEFFPYQLFPEEPFDGIVKLFSERSVSDEVDASCAPINWAWEDEDEEGRRIEGSRRSRQLKLATPDWLNEDEYYYVTRGATERASTMSHESGIPYNAHHEIPLLGKNVCGLNIPRNIKIITQEENLRLSNKFDGMDMESQGISIPINRSKYE